MAIRSEIMKKEILFAIFIGLSLGLLITYGIYRAQKSEENLAVQTTDTIASLEASDEATLSEQDITLFSPEDESVQDEPSVTIAGSTTPESFVIIFVENESFISSADEGGNFALETELTKGSNVIRVHSLTEDGEKDILERTVVFTTTPFETENEVEEEASQEAEVDS